MKLRPPSTPTPSLQLLPVRIAEVAAHWRVSPPTARTILQQRGATIIDLGHGYTVWPDVWRIEGVMAGPPSPGEVEAYTAPLLAKAEVARRYGIAPRTARRWLTQELPAIRLTPRLLRVRAVDLDRCDAAAAGDEGAARLLARLLRQARGGKNGP